MAGKIGALAEQFRPSVERMIPSAQQQAAMKLAQQQFLAGVPDREVSRVDAMRNAMQQGWTPEAQIAEPRGMPNRRPAPPPQQHSPAFLKAAEKARQEAAIVQALRQKFIYAETQRQNQDGSVERIPLIGTSAGLIPAHSLRAIGIEPEPGRMGLGIRPTDLSVEEMEYLIGKKESGAMP